jgi:quercetin dioxygenase-like cupin family protein
MTRRGGAVDERVLHESLPGGAQVLRWPHRHALPDEEVMAFFRARGITATRWSNPAGTVFEEHAHAYRKTLFCVGGTITFRLPDEGRDVRLAPGDRLTLPPGVRHGAIVGASGVTCIEGGTT